MRNFDLNPGGLIGALVGGGIVAVLVFANLKTSEASGNSRFIVFALVIGAFLGNVIWEKVRKKPE